MYKNNYIIPIIVTIFYCVISITYSKNLIDDPSQIPLKKEPYTSGERLRILGDFNFDGLEDMALSDDISTYGTGGIGFTVYLKDSNTQFYKVGRIGGSPHTIAIERHYKYPRIWTYWHMSAASGILSYCEITDTGLSVPYGIDVYPGDGGTKIGNGILKAVTTNSDAILHIQKSKTVDNIIQWVDE